MTIEEMYQIISLLKEFKNDLESSEDKGDVNKVMKIIDKTIDKKQYYSY